MADDLATPAHANRASPIPSRWGGRDELDALCARSATGDQAAATSLYNRFAPGLRRLLLDRSGGREDVADDLLQKTWLNTWNALRAGRYDPAKASFSTYVYTVATHIWLQHLRTSGRSAARMAGGDPETLLDTASGLVGNGDPGSLADATQLLDRVRAALRGDDLGPSAPNLLSPDERQLLRAIASGETDRGLAASLGMAPSTAHARKKTALDKLRRMLAAVGIRDPDAPPNPRQTK